MGFPEGGKLWPMHPVQGLVLAPLTWLAGPVLVTNLLCLLHMGLAGGLMTAVMVRLGARPFAAFMASPLLSLSPVLLSSIQNGNLEISGVFWLPLSLLLALRAEERPSWARRLCLSLSLFLALIDSTYIGISSLILISVWMLRSGSWRLWAQVCGLAALASAPVLAVAAEASMGSEALIRRSSEMVAKMRARGGAVSLDQWFIPGLRSAESPSGGISHYLVGATPGILVVLSLLLWGGWRWRKERFLGAWAWWVLGLLGLFLAMGPILLIGGEAASISDRSIPLPSIFVDRLPPFFMLTELWRFSILLHLALAVGLAGLLSDLERDRGRVFSLVLGIGILIEALSLGSGPRVWQSHMLPERSVQSLMDGREGAVLDLPLRQGRYPLYFQTQHGQPIGNSVTMASVPQLFGLVSAPGWTMDSLVERAKELGFRWLIIHDTDGLRALQPIEAIVEDLDQAGKITSRTDALILVDLHDEGSWPRRPYTGRAGADLTGGP
jgi:hypothetical protein